jgi:hypothetical protein
MLFVQNTVRYVWSYLTLTTFFAPPSAFASSSRSPAASFAISENFLACNACEQHDTPTAPRDAHQLQAVLRLAVVCTVLLLEDGRSALHVPARRAAEHKQSNAITQSHVAL